MLVSRRVITNTKKFAIGDRIELDLDGFGHFAATVQKVDDKKTIFMFDDCVTCSSQGKEMDRFLSKIGKSLSKAIELKVLDVSLPTYGQVFGHDDYYRYFEPDNDEQFQLMKNRKNRVADYDGDYVWWWLKNAWKDDSVSATNFAGVYYYGDASYSGASASSGVRPVFAVENE